MEPKSTRTPIDRFTALTSGDPKDNPGRRVMTTSSRATIQRWATKHSAQPATGEASVSGPAVRTVNDTGAGIRFNFPGFAPFRPIAWDEWFDNFEQNDLEFVFEEEDTQQVAERARERWQTRGGGDGNAEDDWFAAERELLQVAGAATPVRYRLIKRSYSVR
jgi:hypothetical protein